VTEHMRSKDLLIYDSTFQAEKYFN